MDRKLPQPGFGLAVVMALIFLGLQMGLSVPLGLLDAIVEQGFHHPPPRLSQNLFIIGGVNIAAACGAVLFGLFLNRMPFRKAIPSPRLTIAQVAAVMLISLGGAVLLSELDNLTRWIIPPPRIFREIFSEILFRNGNLAGQVFLLVLVAPVTEELMFRGIVLRGLLSRHRPWIAILLSAALFGAVHVNPWQFLPATLLGMAFGWFFLRTGSVPLAMVGHACFNGLALLAARALVNIPGLSTEPLGNELQLQPCWLDAIGATLLLGGIFLFAKAAPVLPKEGPPAAPPVIPFNYEPPAAP